MNKKYSLLVFLLACFITPSGAQSGFPVLTPDSIPFLQITETRSFSDESLYGYIDGGAELYLEYGFDTLVVTEVSSEGKDLKIEIYRMTDAEAAFGIFSVSRYHCNGGVNLTRYYCRSTYQLQFCKERYYVSIINNTGSAAEQVLSNNIAGKILSQISGESFDPFLFFPEGVTDEQVRSAVLVRGRLGIFNGMPSLEETLGGVAGYTAVTVRDEAGTLTSVKFNSEESVTAFLRAAGIDREVLMKGETARSATGTGVSMICLQHLLLKTN